MKQFPNLFLVGAPKCGTTTMSYWLGQNSEIFLPVAKEPFFFGEDFTRSYRISIADYRALYDAWGNELYALDASTQYIYSRTAAEEIKQASPDAKIIVMVRDPMEAAHSLFHENRFTGLEPLPTFEESLAAEDDRARQAVAPKNGHLEQLLYTRIYAFSDNIARYQSAFGADRVHVIRLESLKADPRGELDRVCDFLGLNPHEVAMEVRNPGGKRPVSKVLNRVVITPPPWAGKVAFFIPKTTRVQIRNWLKRINTKPGGAPKMSPDAKRLVAEKFAPETERLSKMLGHDLSHWLRIDA